MCFLLASIYFDCYFLVDGRAFFKTSFLWIPSRSGVFQFGKFCVLLGVNRRIFLSWDRLLVLIFFPCRLPIWLFSYILFLTIFFFLFLFPCQPVVGMTSCILFRNLLGEFFFVILECPVLSALFYLDSISFQSSFFCLYLLFNFPEFYCLYYVAFLFSSQNIPAFFTVLRFLLFLLEFLSAFPI